MSEVNLSSTQVYNNVSLRKAAQTDGNNNLSRVEASELLKDIKAAAKKEVIGDTERELTPAEIDLIKAKEIDLTKKELNLSHASATLLVDFESDTTASMPDEINHNVISMAGVSQLNDLNDLYGMWSCAQASNIFGATQNDKEMSAIIDDILSSPNPMYKEELTVIKQNLKENQPITESDAHKIMIALHGKYGHTEASDLLPNKITNILTSSTTVNSLINNLKSSDLKTVFPEAYSKISQYFNDAKTKNGGAYILTPIDRTLIMQECSTPYSNDGGTYDVDIRRQIIKTGDNAEIKKYFTNVKDAVAKDLDAMPTGSTTTFNIDGKPETISYDAHCVEVVKTDKGFVLYNPAIEANDIPKEKESKVNHIKFFKTVEDMAVYLQSIKVKEGIYQTPKA